MYLGALVHKDDDVWDVIDIVINQLEELFLPHRVYNAKYKKEIMIQTFVGMFLGDTPQRNDFCSLKRQNSDHPCAHCNIEAFHQHTDRIGEERSVMGMLSILKKWINGQKAVKDSLEACHSVKFIMKDKKLRSNPFWRLTKLYDFDIHKDSVVDWFHIGPIGLFKRYIDFMDTVLKKEEVEQLKKLMKSDDFKIFGRQGPPYENRKYWNGEAWLEFFAVAPFLYKAVTSHDSTLTKYYKCLVRLCNWMSILLQRSLTGTEIDRAEALCKEWRREYLALRSPADCNFPNFHNVLHMFTHIRLWGPPVLWWTRPFEAKHRVFRRYIQQSNCRDLEKWIGEQEMIVQSARYLYPHMYYMDEVCGSRHTIKPNDDIMYRSESGEIMYARVQDISKDRTQIKVQKLTFPDKHPLLGCYKYSSAIVGDVFDLEGENYLGKLLITKDCINKYVCLQLIKK
ncbi:hypothetical protein AKO1_015397 [Acrasis kona]|uniref:Uncharacterized protein n=1 Tax=Acrasis kona TaxID=1008807 RepID=A0AAW2YXR0_9EUKA